jgi:arylsulfatase
MDRRQGSWELYDLSKDRAESNNLADRMPDMVEELGELWEQRLAEFRELALKDLPEPKSGRGEKRRRR